MEKEHEREEGERVRGRKSEKDTECVHLQGKCFKRKYGMTLSTV